ncbi:MAG: DUF512 domain-containing protein [Peptococcaceae bacterium]|nr:DUF512 domain-containing protein [Peptococcaceae bacterium]
MENRGLTVGRVADGSIAAETGVEPGDTVVSVNGRAVADLLDYKFSVQDSLVTIDLLKENGERWELEIEKDFDLDLGIEFKTTGLEKITPCRNKCIFCFVDQMPKGLRKSLYIKDDDYRLSFLQGSFITLTNTPERELSRISELRLSPLYVSVHTTDPELRKKMMGNRRAGEILKQLEYLAGHGIEIHTQAVLCPGINDGRELDKTFADLVSLWPGVKSLAVVPVGMTGWRQGLYPLRLFKSEEAGEIVDKVRRWQDDCLKYCRYPFVFASDEFYFLAGREIPPRRRYADFPQTENGVGLTRLFLDQWSRVKRKIPAQINRPLSVSMVTGCLGQSILQPVAARLNRVKNLHTRVVAVKNDFFGHAVTVAGLLTGKDILNYKDELKKSAMVILPSAVIRHEGRFTLDGMTLEELEAGIGTAVKAASGPAELVDIIFG